MRYHAVPWTLDEVPHQAVVQELVDAGLHPIGCLVDDLSRFRAARVVRGHRPDVRTQMLAGVGRPVPVLLSDDRTVAVSVSDLLGSAAVQMRTFLADGSLVETERRWDRVPPWPGRMAPFRYLTTVEREMLRSVASGRTLRISSGSVTRLVDDHRDHVEAVAASRGTTPTSYPDLESVGAGWNAALAHEEAVKRRTDGTVSLPIAAVALAVALLVPAGRVTSGPAAAALLAFLGFLWWAAPGLAVVLRRRITWRPAFRGRPAGVR